MNKLTRIKEAYELMLKALKEFEEGKNISDLQTDGPANLDRWKFYKSVWFNAKNDGNYGCIYFTYHKDDIKPNIELTPNAKLIKNKILEVLKDYEDLIC